MSRNGEMSKESRASWTGKPQREAMAVRAIVVMAETAALFHANQLSSC